MGFAAQINAMYPNLVTGSEGKPNVDHVSQSAPDLFQSLPWQTWEEADLMPALRYMRGNTGLKAPAVWKAAFPEPFEILYRMEARAAESSQT